MNYIVRNTSLQLTGQTLTDEPE